MSGHRSKYEQQAIPGKVVAVSKLPACDFCGKEARYDFATKHGPWAYGCEEHYLEHRAVPQLGVGLGQQLFVPPRD